MIYLKSKEAPLLDEDVTKQTISLKLTVQLTTNLCSTKNATLILCCQLSITKGLKQTTKLLGLMAVMTVLTGSR